MHGGDLGLHGMINKSLPDLTPAEARFIEGIKRLMPNYVFNLSYFEKNRRSNASISERASSSSNDLPSDSRSDKTE